MAHTSELVGTSLVALKWTFRGKWLVENIECFPAGTSIRKRRVRSMAAMEAGKWPALVSYGPASLLSAPVCASVRAFGGVVRTDKAKPVVDTATKKYKTRRARLRMDL